MTTYLMKVIALCSLFTLSGFAFAGPTSTQVIINGYTLNAQELSNLERLLGTRVYPGNYLYDQQSTCWKELNSGAQGCVSGGSQYSSNNYSQTYTDGNGGGIHGTRYGSGEWNGNGDWSYYSNTAGGGVGGSSDGCVYAFGWSNC